MLEVRAHTNSRRRAWGGNWGGVGRGMEVPSHQYANIIVHIVWEWEVNKHIIIVGAKSILVGIVGWSHLDG